MNWDPLLLSLQVTSAATVLAAIVGVALAGLMARSRFLGRDLLETLLTAPMVLPPTVLGYYLLTVLGRTSSLGRAYESVVSEPLVFTRTAAIVAGFLAALPFVVKTTRAAMEEVDPRLTAAAATLGAPPLRVFVTIVLPMSRGGIVAGVTLGFARSLGDFGVTLMIAGNIPGLTQTASLAIYDAVQANREAEAAGLVTVLSAFAIAALYVVTKLAPRKPHAF